jgi:hypothetical protein
LALTNGAGIAASIRDHTRANTWRGSSPDFEQARADFEAAWRIVSAKRTEADYQAWRDDRERTAWRRAMWAAGMMMPTQTQDGTARCFCGATITIASVESHVRTAHATVPAV